MNARKAPHAPIAAYVLHSWDWSETSLIVELFTRERGRVAVAAKGAKRPTSQLRAVLVPFQRIAVQLGRTPADESAEIHVLRTAERVAGPPMPPPAALFAGFYLNELLIRLTARQDPHDSLFDRYASTLTALGLCGGAEDPALQAALRGFELALLRELGLLPELHRVTLTVEPVQPAARYTLHPEAGVTATRGADGIDGTALAMLEAALAGGSPQALADAVRPAAAALRAPLRTLLHYHLGSPVLRTRQVMAEVRRLIDTEARNP